MIFTDCAAASGSTPTILNLECTSVPAGYAAVHCVSTANKAAGPFSGNNAAATVPRCTASEASANTFRSAGPAGRAAPLVNSAAASFSHCAASGCPACSPASATFLSCPETFSASASDPQASASLAGSAFAR